MSAKLIVGLGNPGKEYANSRHNVGFRCADYIASKLEIQFKFEKKKSVYGKKKFKGSEVIVLKPQTFANLSGEAVLYIASFLRVEVKDIFIIFDALHRNFGSVEIEKRFDKISHNAVMNLAQALGSEEFLKCAFGVGPMPKDTEPDTFYLGDFSSDEETQFQDLFERTYDLALSTLAIESP